MHPITYLYSKSFYYYYVIGLNFATMESCRTNVFLYRISPIFGGIIHSPMERITYTDMQSLIELYKNDDLPKDEMAFSYKDGSGTIRWIHRDELKKQLALQDAYSGANNQKGK